MSGTNRRIMQSKFDCYDLNKLSKESLELALSDYIETVDFLEGLAGVLFEEQDNLKSWTYPEIINYLKTQANKLQNELDDRAY